MRHVLRLTTLGVLLAAFAAPVPVSHAQPAEASPSTPERYVLSGAYPNPFQTRAQFTLFIEETQPVRVEVYNVLGQRVEVLHDDVLPGGVPHTFTLEAGALPNGLYLYRVRGESFVATRRIMLLR